MAVRIWIKDESDGRVHEYGTNCHDCLVVCEGRIHYINLQNCESTRYGGYSFCGEKGQPLEEWELGEQILNIGGNWLDRALTRWRRKTFIARFKWKYLRAKRRKGKMKCEGRTEHATRGTGRTGKPSRK